MQYYTPLRYPGGKGRLAEFMKDVFRHNELCDGTYIEPYAGGAAVALNLLMEEYAWRIVINDLDPLVHAFWHTVLDETDWLLKMIADTRVDMDTWRNCRAVHADPGNHEPREVGFATFFQNRTNRSGILTAGVIGGQKQVGPYKLDARYNVEELSRRIKRIALYRNRITLMNLDALELLASQPEVHDRHALIYLDPPYYHKGSMLYSNFYTHEDHAAIASHMRELDVPWILTYDSVPEIHALYEDEPRFDFTLTYTANSQRKKGNEVMYYGHLELPSKYIKAKTIHFKHAC